MTLITPDVLRTVAENITGADAVSNYTPAEYGVTAWPSLYGPLRDRPMILVAHDPENLEVARGGPFTESFNALLVARVIAELARTVVANDDGDTKFDAEDVLETLYGEIDQIRIDGYYRGLKVVFTATEVD